MPRPMPVARLRRAAVAGAVLSFVAAMAAAEGDPVPPAAPPLSTLVSGYVRRHSADVVREYAALLSLPNLARDASGTAANARHIARMLEARGLAARLLDGEGGPPVVYGALDRGAARTLALYAHYDGQPVVASDWTSPPWTPVLRAGPSPTDSPAVDMAALTAPVDGEWRLFARSASDDKAPIEALVVALDALAAVGARPTVNLKVFFEGEEEAGSPHLGRVLENNRELLRADAWLLCDGPVHQSRRMQLYFGARGITEVELALYGPTRAVHSGHYGNWVPNPAVALAHLVAGLRDTDGRITIAGFYDDVRAPTTAEQAALVNVPDVDQALRDELEVAETEAGDARLVERLMLPALNLRGLAAGAVGAAAANAIPTDARASIDFRLVPDQTPARVRQLFEAHLRSRGFAIVDHDPSPAERRATPNLVRLQWGAGYPPARTPMDDPFSRRLVAVVEEAAGRPIVTLPTLGGSIPMYLFVDVFGVPVVGLPIVNHDNRQHAADENLRLENLWEGIGTFAAVLAGMGEGWPAPGH